jgi:transposase
MMDTISMSSAATDDVKQDDPPYVQYSTRRGYQLWFKLQLVKESLAPGNSVSIVARRHNLNCNLLFSWRKQYHEGVLRPLAATDKKDGFVPLGVIGGNGEILPATTDRRHPNKSSLPPRLTAAQPSTLPAPKPVSSPQPPAARAVPMGSIELQLCGKIKIRVEGDVDQDMLRRVLAAAREFV